MKEDSILVDYAVADLTAENECARVVTAANGSLGGLTTGTYIDRLSASPVPLYLMCCSCEQRWCVARGWHGCRHLRQL